MLRLNKQLAQTRAHLLRLAQTYTDTVVPNYTNGWPLSLIAMGTTFWDTLPVLTGTPSAFTRHSRALTSQRWAPRYSMGPVGP